MDDTVLASGLSDQVRARAAGSLQLLAVTEALPGTRRLEFRPTAVVRMVTFVMAAREVGYSPGENQQSVGARGGALDSFRPTVFAELLIQVAPVAVSHALHDGASGQECRIGQAIGAADEMPLLDIRSWLPSMKGVVKAWPRRC